MKNKQQTENKENNKDQNNMPSAKEQYNIILKLYKGLHENLEELHKKSKDKKSSTNASQLAYKVDKIASGLHLTLNFEDEKTVKISENFRELYRHVRFAMKMIYEKQEYKFLNSSFESYLNSSLASFVCSSLKSSKYRTISLSLIHI